MSFSTATLVQVGRLLLICGGFGMTLFGMFGALMILLLFSRRPLNRNPCSTYMTATAALSFLFLPLYFVPNIVTFGFQINWLAQSGAFCRFEMSYAIFTVTSAFVLNCFVSLDRFAVTSRSVHIRSLSSLKISRYLVVIAFLIVWFLMAMPVAILFDVRPVGLNGTDLCTSRSTTLLIFAALVYFPLIEGVLPIVLAIYFWYITRRHVRRLNNQEVVRRFDKQITRICFFQILSNAIASLPFATINLYNGVTSQTPNKSQSRQDIELFFHLLAILLFYIQFSCDFYIYIATSSEIRVKAVHMLCFWHHRNEHRNNRVGVMQIQIQA